MSEYDPKDDDSLKCACSGSETAYENGWEQYFRHDIVEQQLKLAADEMDSIDCPRLMVRHAAGRLAVAIALLSNGGNDSVSSQDVERMLADIPAMLRPMVADAQDALGEQRQKHRGRAAGFRRVSKMN